MRRLSILLACSAALAVAACHDRDPVASPAPTDPPPVIVDNGTVAEPVEDGFTCPPRMPAAKCESLGGHYAPRGGGSTAIP